MRRRRRRRRSWLIGNCDEMVRWIGFRVAPVAELEEEEGDFVRRR